MQMAILSNSAPAENAIFLYCVISLLEMDKFNHFDPIVKGNTYTHCSNEKRCHKTGGTLFGYLLTFSLSFRLSRFTLSQPLLELPLTFFSFVIVENVRQDATGNVLDFVLWNTGIVDKFLFAAQVGCSLRFDIELSGAVLDGGRSVAVGLAPFSRNRKCRRLSSLWLDRRLHFAYLYYSTLRVAVKGMGSNAEILGYANDVVKRFSRIIKCNLGSLVSLYSEAEIA